MTYTTRAQRLMLLSAIAGKLEYEAYMAFNRPRAIHFMRKMNRLTQLAIKAQNGGAV